MANGTSERGGSLRAAPLLAFAFLLIIPFLNVELTFYRNTLKLFAFQTVAAGVWCLVLFEWAGGRVRGTDWPAWWLFAPVGAWVVWGLLAYAWSRQGWLGAEWVVQGASGAAGAAGLAVLLSERGHRRMFVAAASAVVAALALYMAAVYGDPQARFLGDLDLSAREAGAAFVLLPTLVAAAALYQLATDPERNYRAILWAAAALVVMLASGLRTASGAWLLALGVGVAVVAWMMVRRWRMVAALLVVLVVLSGAKTEVERRARARNFVEPTRQGYWALLDGADWRVVRGAGLARLVAGSGVGSFFMALDRSRPPETYAARDGDKVVGHARRQATEVVFERGLVGLALALACGAAWVVAGWFAHRRADNPLDSALGAGLAAGGVAIGVFACFSNGAIGFGAALNFWFGLAVLGALAGRWGRPAALGWSAEEEFARREKATGLLRLRGLAALVAALVVAVVWWRLGLRPFWAEWCLKDGEAEAEAVEVLAAQSSAQASSLQRLRMAGDQALDELKSAVDEAERAARKAGEALGAARKKPATPKMLKELEKKKAQADAKLVKLRKLLGERTAVLDAAVKEAEANLARSRQAHSEALGRARRLLEDAGRLCLGGRVWLNAQLRLALLAMGEEDFAGAVGRLREVQARCGGPAFDLDLLLARCYARLRRPAEAHALFRRYAAKNPFAAACALRTPRSPVYGPWFMLIADQRRKKAPQWRAWAEEFIEAASHGLELYPQHYALLLYRGQMRYLAGKLEAARRDMAEADRIIAGHLAGAPSPEVRANLLIETANANSHWNKPKALKAAREVLAMNLDWRRPRYRALRRKAEYVIRMLQSPSPRASTRPPSAKGPKKKPQTR